MRSSPRNAARKASALALKGGYGARPYSRASEGAKQLIAAIEVELGSADFFTRDDLLSIGAFSHVAVATRISYIRESLADLITRGRVLERSRTELCLAGRARAYRSRVDLESQYAARVLEIATGILAKREAVGVADIVAAWRTDPHLTDATKRTTARNVLKGEAKAGGSLQALSLGTFRRRPA